MKVLEAVEDAVGRLDDRALSNLQDDASDLWLEGLWRNLRPLIALDDKEQKGIVPERVAGGLQPYLPFRIFDGDREFVGDFPVYDGAHQRPDPRIATAVVARHLLYCNRLVMDDPMWWVVCDGVGYAEGGPIEFSDDDRAKLRSRKDRVLWWLDTIRALRPLLSADRLVLLPPTLNPTYWWARTIIPEPPRPDGLVTNADIADYCREQFGADWRGNGDRREELVLEIGFSKALDDMKVQLQASAFYGHRLDLSPVNAFHSFALDALLRRGAEAAPKELQQAAMRFHECQPLAALPVFLTIGDRPEEVAALAADDEGFARWRVALGRALRSVQDLDRSSPGYTASVQARFHDELEDAVAKLREARDSNTWMGALRPKVSSIGVSGVSAAATLGVAALLGFPFTIPIAVAGTAVAQGASALLTYARGGRARKQGGAVDELFEILDDVDGRRDVNGDAD